VKEAIERHWSRDANNYNKSAQITMRADEAKKLWQELFAEALGRGKKKILDVGTGPGIVAFMLSELGHDVTGVDLSEGMINNALKNREEYGLKVEFRRGDAEKLPFNDRSFDAVVSRYVLWTVTDPKRALSEWNRVLKPGGRVVIVDGDWQKNKDSLKKKAWHTLSLGLIAITEKKNPLTHEFKPGLRKELWSSSASRPGDDLKYLRECGFGDLKLKEDIRIGSRTLIDHLKYGYQENAYLITGIKK
jgi:ubiquinone/menaquinone biosynthesis C-methylase UbiE